MSVKLLTKIYFLKFGLSWVSFGRYALCGAIYTCLKTFWSVKKKKKFKKIKLQKTVLKRFW